MNLETLRDMDGGADDDEAPDFSSEATEVLSNARAAVATTLAAISRRPIRRAIEIERLLGVDRKLAWQLYNLASTPDPLKAGRFIPGRGAVKTFVAAAKRRGAEREGLDAVVSAFDELERLIERHADDGSAFEQMLTSVAADETDEIPTRVRREAYRAQRGIWGKRISTSLVTLFVHPGAEDGTVDLLNIFAMFGMSQLREQVSPFSHIGGRVEVEPCGDEEEDEPDAEPQRPVTRGPIVAGDDPISASGLLERFCSQPFPPIETVETENGRVRTTLRTRGIGNASAIDLVFADITRNVAVRFDPGLEHSHSCHLCTPTEVAFCDLLIHADLLAPLRPRGAVYGSADGSALHQAFSEADRLPLAAPVDALGAGPDALLTPDVPRYPELARYALGLLGWDGERFTAFRIRMEYPIVPSALVIRSELRAPHSR